MHEPEHSSGSPDLLQHLAWLRQRLTTLVQQVSDPPRVPPPRPADVVDGLSVTLQALETVRAQVTASRAGTTPAREALPHAALDALAAHIAVLDAQGTIVAVNTAWGRFHSARQAAASTGLTPKQHESGSSVPGRTRLSKSAMHGSARHGTGLPSQRYGVTR
jgi:hypothetical protein